jgi:glycosyltransferase involved in cell wall biosynthesis
MSFKQMGKKLLYASNVSNIAHLEHILMNSPCSIYVMRPWIPKKWLISVVSKYSAKLSSILRTRDSDRTININHITLNLGFVQFYAPFRNLLSDSPMTLLETNLVNYFLRIKVKKHVVNKDIVITTRDIFPSFKSRNQKIILTEMRELHRDNLWNRQIAIGGFPFDPTKRNLEISTYREHFEKIRLNASGLITYSDISKDSFIANGYSEEKIFVFPLKYPKNFTHNQNVIRSNKTLFVGRDDLNKGLDLAVLMSKEAGTKLVVVGHYSRSVIDWLRKFEHVEFKGSVNRYHLQNIMFECHAVIAPSVESYGLVVIEALESGCLVVSSKLNGAAATFIQNPNLFCSENLEIDDLIEKLRSAMQSNFNHEYVVEKRDYSTKFATFLEDIQKKNE